MLKRRELLTGAAAIAAMRSLPADAQTWAPFMMGAPPPVIPPGNSVVVFGTYAAWLPESIGLQSPFWYNQQEFGAGGFAVNQGPNGVVLTGTATTNINSSGQIVSSNGVANGTTAFSDTVANAFTQAMVGHRIGISGGTDGAIPPAGVTPNLFTVVSVQDAGHITLAAPITPNRAFTHVDWRFNEFIDRTTINDTNVFPNNVTMLCNWGASIPGAPRSALTITYCNISGSQLNSSVASRTQSYVPQPAQVANWSTFQFGYDFTSQLVTSWDVIGDWWLMAESDPYGQESGAPGRLFEIDVLLFARNLSAFSLIGTRLFNIAGTGLWDGNWFNIGDFGWRFTTSRPNPATIGNANQVGNINALALHQQLVWNGASTGREYGQGHNLILEPLGANNATLQVNSYTGSWVSNPDITIAAGGTGVRAYPRGNHFRGAGAGQGSRASFPNAYATYQMRRLRDRVLVRSSNNLSTLDFVSTRGSTGVAVTTDGCDQIVFTDKTVTITSIPMVPDIALTLKMPFTANQTVATLQAQASSPVTNWQLTTNPNSYFALSNAGVLTLTAAGAANLSPTTLNYASLLTSSFATQASPGTGFRVVVGGGLFFSTTNPYLSNQVSIRIATTASNGGGTLDSLYVGARRTGSSFVLTQVVQATFNGSATLNLAAGAATYVSDPVVFPIGGAFQTSPDFIVGFHVTGANVRLGQGFGTPLTTFWATNAADVGTADGSFPNAQSGQLIGVSAVDTGLTQWIDLEAEASNANGKGIGLITVFNPIYAWFKFGPPTITNNGTTATAVASANGDMAQVNQGQLFRKYYCELTVNTLDGAGSVGLGIFTGGTSTNIVMGSDNNSCGAFADSSGGLIRLNGATVGTMGVNAGNGSVIRMAIDLDDDLPPNGTANLPPPGSGHFGWWAVGNGLWNGTVGADPVTGVGGIPLNGVPAVSGGGVTRYQGGGFGGPIVYPVAYVKNNGTGARATINTGSLPFQFLCPPGFIGWINNADGSPPPAVSVAPPSNVPTVVSVVPNTGTTGGNRPITINGTNLTGATQVTLGGTAAVGIVVAGNGLSLTCRTPRHAVGAVSVIVTTPVGSNTANTAYSYVIEAPVGTTLTPPTQASAHGFNTLSFQEEFNDLLSVNTAEQITAPGSRSYPNTFVGPQNNVAGPQPGYNFYAQAYGWLDAFDPVQRTGDGSGIQYEWAEYYGITSSILHIVGRNGGRDRMGGLVSVATIDQHAAFAGATIDFANGFYWEIRAQLPPFNNYFDFWNFSVDSLVGTNALWAEVDTAEYLTSSQGGVTNRIDNVINTWNAASPTTVSGSTPFLTNATISTAFHVYGALFLPPVGASAGSVQWYMDGSLVNTVTIPAGGGSTLANIATQHRNELKISASTVVSANYTQFIDYVRVWQTTATG